MRIFYYAAFVEREDIMGLENILNTPWPLYAHREAGKEKELLEEHVDRCIKYRDRILEEKNGKEILDHFFCEFGLKDDTEAWKLAREMFYGLQIFHDVGKARPAFQKSVMKNEEMEKVEWGKDDVSDHSLLSGVIFLDYYLGKIQEILPDKEEKRALTRIAWESAYVISRHHSDLCGMGQFLNGFYETAGRLVEKLEKNSLPGYVGLQFLDTENLNKRINQYRNCRKKMERETDIAFFFYARFAYSVLVASDYYAASEYASGIDETHFGSADYEAFRKIYDSTKLVNSIRKYQKEDYGKTEWIASRNINVARNELFLEAEEELLHSSAGEHLFFLEAPTGSGKSNTAMNLGFHLLKGKKKLFYIYPYNTLVEQNLDTLKQVFGNTGVENQIAVVNSLTPIKERKNMENDSVKYYQEALLDRQFLNYPFILSTHVSLFNMLFGVQKENAMSFWQLANSVVIMDEIQSYRNAIWAEIMIFLYVCAKIMGMKIVIMSATLPGLETLAGKDCVIKRLIQSPQRYFQHPLFGERVKISFELLNEKITMEKLLAHVLQHSEEGKKVLVTFIRKESAYQFFELLQNQYEGSGELRLITGDDSMFEREQILRPIRENQMNTVILVSTQVVEAGVDIDMDIGYKDISKLDSEEQFMGRINRSCKRDGIVYFFDMDQAKRIYEDDYRIDKAFTLQNEKMREILVEKNFATYYQSVMEALKKKRNDKTSEEGLRAFFGEKVKELHFPDIAERMKLIREDDWHMSIVLCRRLEMEDGTILDGLEVWREYRELLQDREMEYAKRQVVLSQARSKLSYFLYQIKKNPNLPYSDVLGELYCIEDGDKYFVNGKLNRNMLEQEGVMFIE